MPTPPDQAEFIRQRQREFKQAQNTSSSAQEQPRPATGSDAAPALKLAPASPHVKAAMPYNTAIADEVCRRMADGENLNQICRDRHMPTRARVIRWSEATDGSSGDFPARYAQARLDLVHYLIDEAQDIADDGRNDWMEKETHTGGRTYKAVNDELIRRSQVRIAFRQWLAERLLREIYGRDTASQSQQVIIVNDLMSLRPRLDATMVQDERRIIPPSDRFNHVDGSSDGS